MRAEEFLQNFRVLEETLEAKYAGKTRRHSSVVMEYINDPESLPVREDLDMIREMRNLLSHNADQDGNMVFEPSQGVLKTLESILDYARKPPLAYAFATPVDKLLCAGQDSRVLPLMRIMEKRGFSHVPVTENGRLTGVFSIRTVFSRMAQTPDYEIRSDTTLYHLRSFLPLNAHRGESYRFMARDVSLSEVRQAFSSCPLPNRRLAAVFLTKTGREDEPLLGMLTPWDALGRRER